MLKHYLRLMVDSGAFTTWRQGESIDLNTYIAWLQENQQHLSSYINLDSLPGKPGVARTHSQTEEAALLSYKNAVKMRKAGLNPMVVYHMGERPYHLERMVGEGFNYIGLGGMAVAGDKARTPWIRQCFSLLCGTSPYPEVKVHGLGVTSVEVMNDYPWFSVDSISWFKQAVTGGAYIPKWNGIQETYDYSAAPHTIAFSAPGHKGPSSQAIGHGTHIEGCGKSTRRYILDYVKHEGFDPQLLAQDYEQRIQLNARFFRNYAKARKPRPFVSRAVGLMDRVGKGLSPSREPPSRFRLVMGLGTYLDYGSLLRRENHRDVLISYHRIATGPTFDLEEFVRTGWFVRDSMRGIKKPWEGGRCGNMQERKKIKTGLGL